MTAGIGTAFYTGALGTFWGGIASAATSGLIAGAVSGGVGAGLNGQNIFQGTLMGAGFGALGGAVFGGISNFGGKNWNWKIGLARVGMASAAGGGISVLAGGSFEDGAMFAGIVAGSDFVYRAILKAGNYNRGASMKTAKKDGIPEYDLNEKNEYVLNKSKELQDFDANQAGTPGKPANALKTSWDKLAHTTEETGSLMNFLGKHVPGVQGLSLPHDLFHHAFGESIYGKAAWGVLNIPTMPVAYGLNAAGSMINDSPGMIGFYSEYRENY